MVKYLGDYSHVADDQATHCILLEYAENDLAEYFFQSPPVLSEHIEQFWTNLMRVPSAIQGLHSFETHRLKTGKATKYKGCVSSRSLDSVADCAGPMPISSLITYCLSEANSNSLTLAWLDSRRFRRSKTAIRKGWARVTLPEPRLTVSCISQSTFPIPLTRNHSLPGKTLWQTRCGSCKK
jgi:hypothetical protein